MEAVLGKIQLSSGLHSSHLIKGMVVGTVSHSFNASIQEVDFCEVRMNEPWKRLSQLLRELDIGFFFFGGGGTGGGRSCYVVGSGLDSVCLCLLNARIKGIRHHVWLK